MGVKLKSLITSTTLPLSALKGKTIAVDGTNMLFQILYNPYQMQKKLPDTFYLDRTMRVISHLYGWLQKAIGFYKAKILPVIVFDGVPDISNKKPTGNMARNFLSAKKHYEKALKSGEREGAKEAALSRSYMFLNCVHESKALLEACGIPVVMAPGEAEAQCVYLLKQGKVDYVVSTDYDVLLYGAPEYIRQITFSTRAMVDGKWKSVKPDLIHIDLKTNLEALGITQRQLIDLSILLGNDYYPGISGIGPKKAISSIKHYRNLENMIKTHPELFKNAQLPQDKIKWIRNKFLKPRVRRISSKFSESFLQLDALRELLVENHTLDIDKVDKYLTRLTKAHKSFSKSKKRQKKTLESHIPVTGPENNISSKPLRESNEEVSPIRTKAEEVIRDPSKPHRFSDSFQRRLNRGHKKSQPSNISYEFTSATHLKIPSKKIKLKKVSK